MAQLIVRRLEEEVVRRLKARASESGVSVEEAHRRLLRECLLKDGSTGSFKDALLSIPPVGSDKDFERIPQPQREVTW